ncbi:cobaltochelatase subunit CobN [Methanobacterium alcaliphilum]|uniref:cobaltochelatase subunit CobN n=1 Tax=Methanobacterium alcaliphilum TaxID=392018 RepID=UPI00200AE993|nr:cobaltochelatase subunit CobN [Methanobacterium alcaliphilum]MCK9151180.1 cobaltochelatase subunit CobN [Methanobacterium alcaliphilum]
MEVKKIRKQVIFILTTFVFIMACCGAVAATDSQGGVNDTQTTEFSSNETNDNSNQGTVEPDPRIYGVILNNTTPAHGAIINIKNPTNNLTLASGVTNASGEYDIYFNSSLTQFQVEIIFSTFKTFTTTVTPTGSPIPTAELNHTFVPSKMLKDVKMVILVAGSRVGTIDRVMNDVYLNQLLAEGYDFELKIFAEDTASTDTEVFEKFSNELKTANIFVMINPGSNVFTAYLSSIVKNMPNGSKIYLIGGSNPLSGFNVTTLSYSSVLNANLSPENIKRAMLAVLKDFSAISSSTNTTIITMPTDFVYHPDTTQIFVTRQDYVDWYVSAGKYKVNGPWVALIFHSWYYGANDLAAYNALIYALEERGVNVIVPIMSSFSTVANTFFMVNGTPAIDVLITHLHSGMTDNASVSIINQLNVPILSPVHVFLQDTIDGYLAYSMGLTGNELTTWIITPEINGRIEPVLIGGSKSIGVDPITGADVKIFVPYQPGIDQLADRAYAWGVLKHTLNSDKKLALIYFDNTHDEGMPVGGSLNIEASLANILKALAADGYNIGSLSSSNITAESVLALITDHGRNLVNYTQQDLATLIQKGAPTMSVQKYLELYNQLPASLRKQVEDVWGPAPGTLMIYNGQIVFPGIMLGNIFMGPQPIWKWNGSTSDLSDDTLPPTHQYIAFYLWLQDVFDANAVVHVGEHGTLELLPGHTAGMTEDDWPNTLIGEMPHIYIYSGANNNAKRRAYAVIISHLTPPVVDSALYGNLLEMHDLLESFNEAYNQNDSERMAILKAQIWNKIDNQTGLAERLDINSNTSFGTVLNRLHDYLHTLEQSLTTYGLHTFGELPDNETLEKFIAAIIAYDPGNRTGMHDYILDLLNQSVTNEMASLLKALNGGYITPGVAGDPVRDLTSLPTGRNTYSFDPRKVPDSAALIIGTAAAEAVLQQYFNSTNGTFPETIGTSIRGGTTIATNGVDIATIFYFLGVKPVYLNGVIVGTEVIPLEDLTITIGNTTVQRPRIDVMIGASVSFINVCYNIIELIDKAVQQVALLNESITQNFVRKHYLAMMGELKAELIAQGLSQSEAEIQAERLARARIFGLPPGADPHAMGTARLLRSSESWTEEELAEAYLEYESYLYGYGLNGVPGRSVMEKLLKTVETSMVISARVTNGATAPTYRGITMIEFMVKRLTGRNITSYVVNTGYAKIDGTTVTGITVRTLPEALYDSITMTLLNPVWRQGMLSEGSAGQRRIALAIRSMYTLNINGAISPAMWQNIANMYLFGPNKLTDPMAISMLASVIDRVSKHGMMQLTSEQAKMLAKIMGVEGTESDPGNPSTPSTPSKPSSPSSPGAPSGPSGPSGSSSSPGTSVSTSSSVSAQSVDSSEAAAEAGDASSQKAYEVSKTDNSSSKDDYNYAYAIVGLCSLMGLIGFGYFKGIGRN